MFPGQDNTNMNNKETLWAIPKLTPNSSNWVTIKTQFLFTRAGHNLEGHFDASDPTLPAPTYSTPNEERWTAADREKNLAYLPLARKWKPDKHIACAQLAQVMSDSLLIWIQHTSTVADMWKNIVAEFNHKGQMVQMDLHCRMM